MDTPFLPRLNRAKPVSYTHLDVYKRQTLDDQDHHYRIGRMAFRIGNTYLDEASALREIYRLMHDIVSVCQLSLVAARSAEVDLSMSTGILLPVSDLSLIHI